jgi:hypothetical protein
MSNKKVFIFLQSQAILAGHFYKNFINQDCKNKTVNFSTELFAANKFKNLYCYPSIPP